MFKTSSAVTNYVGTSGFTVCDDNYGVFNAIGAVRHPGAKGHATQIVEVSTTTIDTYIEQQGLRSIHLLKIDAEGAELAVLQGARDLLIRADAPTLICEFSTMAGGDDSGHVVWKYARDCGYRWYELDANGAFKREVQEAPVFAYANLVAVKGSLESTL